jgi:type IV pilus assembly protein PilY1
VKRYLFLLWGLIFLSINPLYGDDTDLFTARVDPNLLIVMDNSASMNEVIYHRNYDPETTYTGDGTTYISGRIYYFKDTDYKTIDFAANGRTAKLYWGPGDEGNGVRYDGNYLNWIYWVATEDERNTLPQKTRIQVAREVLTNLVNNTSGVRFGLMQFNSDNGGTLVADCGASKETIVNAINGMLATTWTPVSETMVEAWLYFTGDNKSFYNNANYKPRIPIQYYCQKSFIILITDGEPTRDWTFPDWVLPAISGHYDTTPQSGNSNNPYYLDGVAWYLSNNDAAPNLAGPQNVWTYPIGFNIDHPLLNRTAACNKNGLYLTAGNANELSAALQKVIIDVQSNTPFEFTAPTVLAVRIEDQTDNIVYLTTFKPSIEPFWEGNLRAYRLNADGTLPVDENGDPIVSNSIWGTKFDSDLQKDVALGTGDKLIASGFSLASRKIYSYLGSSLNLTDASNAFTKDNALITPTLLGLSSEQDKIDLVQFVRGYDAYDYDGDKDTNEKRDWILGDIFHSNAVIVGEPSRFFRDECFNQCSDGSESFYNANKNREKIILVGANDGMLHAFNAKTGNEEWAFIPESLLKNLKSMLSTHTYYVDSSPKVADVWFYSGSNLSGNTKTKDEWKTVLVCGSRKGGKHYFALDITNTLSPKYLWEFPKPTDSVTLAKVGQSWSEPAIGRVRIKEGDEPRERWVAFIGGGFDSTHVTGKGFFVIDIKTGDILVEFSALSGMDYSIAAPPTAVDTNADGYIDKVYIGDLGGQMWVFDVSSNEKGDWTGKRLFKAPGVPVERRPIFTQPAVAFDKRGTPWVYFGTGDRENPKDKLSQGFYAVKDDGKDTYPRTEEKLKNVSTYIDTTFVTPQVEKGWYIRFTQSSEKVLAKPTVFSKLLYFTTYTYTSADVCKAAGEATLYTVEYLSGGGALVLDDYLQGKPSARSQRVGSGSEGVPSAPVISVDLKGKATLTIGTTSGKILSKGVLSPVTNKEILYWREVIP